MHSVTVWNTFCHRMHYVTERNLFCDRMYSVTECNSFCHRMHSVTECNLFCHRLHSVTKCYTFCHRMHSANYSIFYILFFFQSHKRLPICGVFGKRMHRTRKQNRKWIAATSQTMMEPARPEAWRGRCWRWWPPSWQVVCCSPPWPAVCCSPPLTCRLL